MSKRNIYFQVVGYIIYYGLLHWQWESGLAVEDSRGQNSNKGVTIEDQMISKIGYRNEICRRKRKMKESGKKPSNIQLIQVSNVHTGTRFDETQRRRNIVNEFGKSL